MNIIIATLIAIIILLLYISFSAVFYSRWTKDNEKFIEKTVEKVSSLINSKLVEVTNQSEAGPWYLVVYTKDSNYPIWVSNNNIRSVHPDPELCNLIVKQFNGEDMVIENVENYEMRAANKMFDYEM